MVTRRTVLRGLAGALITLPALEAFRRRASAAAETKQATRFVGIMIPDGVHPEHWYPQQGGETDFVLGPHLAELEAVRQHMLLFRGVHNQAGLVGQPESGNPHIEGVTGMLTARQAQLLDLATNDWTARGPSIDQVIARAQIDAGYLPKLTSVDFGHGNGPYGSISYTAAGQATAQVSASQLFDSLFENPEQTAEAQAIARARKKSILDGTAEDFRALSTRVSGEDKRRIEAHLETIRELEARLDNAAICAPPTVNLSPEDDDQRRQLYFDLLVAAMTCDATRVATMAFHHSGGGGPQLPFANVLQDIHELSHQVVDSANFPGCIDEFNRYHQWIHGTTLDFVQKLKGVNLPDGRTLFDETVVLSCSDISWNHLLTDMPFLMLAGSETPFRTGRYVQVPGDGVPHNHLLTTVAHAFGVPLAGFGQAPFDDGDMDDALLVPA
jgi:hypothetical protein